ncbi:MAG: hypothetical protein ACPGWR_10910 [Ardenticatenaceae bacterium]
MNSQFIDINLLPKPVRPPLAQTIWVRRMVPGLILLCLAAILVLSAILIKRRNDRQLSQQRIEMENKKQDIREFSFTITQVELLQQQINTLLKHAEQLEQDAIRIERENPSLASFLRIVTDTLLPRMTLTGFVVEGPKRFVIQGEAGSPALVVSYVESLKAQPRIRTVTARSIEQIGGDGAPTAVRWTIEIKLP